MRWIFCRFKWQKCIFWTYQRMRKIITDFTILLLINVCGAKLIVNSWGSLLDKKERYIKFSLKLHIFHWNIVKKCKVIYNHITMFHVGYELPWWSVTFYSRVAGSIQVHRVRNESRLPKLYEPRKKPYTTTTPGCPTSCISVHVPCNLVAHNHACTFLFTESHISLPQIQRNTCIFPRFLHSRPFCRSGIRNPHPVCLALTNLTSTLACLLS